MIHALTQPPRTGPGVIVVRVLRRSHGKEEEPRYGTETCRWALGAPGLVRIAHIDCANDSGGLRRQRYGHAETSGNDRRDDRGWRCNNSPDDRCRFRRGDPPGRKRDERASEHRRSRCDDRGRHDDDGHDDSRRDDRPQWHDDGEHGR